MLSKALKHLTESAGGWPIEDQVELADYARVIAARRSGRYAVSDVERASIFEATSQADRGEFVSNLVLKTARFRHRL
jgi:hypothetical protein